MALTSCFPAIRLKRRARDYVFCRLGQGVAMADSSQSAAGSEGPARCGLESSKLRQSGTQSHRLPGRIEGSKIVQGWASKVSASCGRGKFVQALGESRKSRSPIGSVEIVAAAQSVRAQTSHSTANRRSTTPTLSWRAGRRVLAQTPKCGWERSSSACNQRNDQGSSQASAAGIWQGPWAGGPC